MRIAKKRAEEILNRAEGRSILVVGDLMLDRFTYGEVSRISPEAPVPVVKVTRETAMPGGACNVASNLLALGAKAAMAGFVGIDAEGEELRRRLAVEGISLDAVVRTPDAPTCAKTRIVAGRQQVVRIDREEYLTLPDEAMADFCAQIEREAAKTDGIVIEDYGKGAVRQPVVDAVLRAAQKAGIPVGYDPKDDHVLQMEGVTVVTPNRKEAFAAAGIAEGPPAENPLEDGPLLEVGERLREKWKAGHTLVTLGPHGMLLLDREGGPRHVPTRAREVFDVSGAGDTVIAAFVLALVGGATFPEAAELANFAAGVVVGKVGTATCTREELLDYLDGHGP